MRKPALIKKYFPIFAALVIIVVAALIYLDRPNTTFSPYVDLTLNVHWEQASHSFEPVDLALASDESDVWGYHVGFISDSGSCNPAWGGEPDFSVYNAWAKKAIDALIANDVELTITLGSRTGTDISARCTPVDLLRAYETIINLYKPKGLDFNIENSTAQLKIMMSTLAVIQKNHPTLKLTFTVLTLPSGLIPLSESVVQEAKAAGLIYSINLLVMNYGMAYTGNMANYAIEASKNTYLYLLALYPQQVHSTLWKMIELTPMIGLNNIEGERFTLEDADTLINYAKHFKLGGISMRSANRDFPCATLTANNYCSGDNIQTKPYEFETHFLK